MINKLSLTAALLSVVFHHPVGSVQSLQERRRYPCAVCGKSYVNKGHLKRHVTQECIGIAPQFVCSYCGFRYKRKELLNRHVLLVHNIDLRRNHKAELLKTYTYDEAPLPIYYSKSNFSPETVWQPTAGSQHLRKHFQSQHLPPQPSSSQPHFNDRAYFIDYTHE